MNEKTLRVIGSLLFGIFLLEVICSIKTDIERATPPAAVYALGGGYLPR